MRIGLAQTRIIWEDKAANLARMERFLSLTKADCMLFPEMSLTGFSMHTDKTAERNPDSVRKVQDLAHKYKTIIGIGWVRQTDTLCENHYTLVTGDSDAAMDAVKVHPFSYSGEDRYFRGGDRVSVGTVGEFQAGVCICYDLRFPEQFRAMIPDAELILVPANWPAARAVHWKTLLAARAIENQCYIAGINCCGVMDGQYYAGDSCLIAPDGTTMEPAQRIVPPDSACPEEVALVYELANNVRGYRETFPALRDRKNILIES